MRGVVESQLSRAIITCSRCGDCCDLKVRSSQLACHVGTFLLVVQIDLRQQSVGVHTTHMLRTVSSDEVNVVPYVDTLALVDEMCEAGIASPYPLTFLVVKKMSTKR